MMTKQSLEALVPKPHARHALACSTNGALTVHGAPPAGYVWPRVESSGSPNPTAVTLLSAPGAMGKTVAARALSATAGAPSLDLAKIRVGSGTLAGELGKFLGMAEAGAFLDDLRTGQSALIIDGIDEAQLQSGTEHFFAFMEDLADAIAGSAPRAQVVVLGRPDSIAGAEAVLSQRQVPYSSYTLLPLDREQASQLISNSLDNTEYVAHRTNPLPFGELRDAVLLDLARALTGDSTGDLSTLWGKSADFLGYPPVLEAIGTRLQFPNPKAELERVRSQPTDLATSRGQLLVQVAERILDRDTEKVRASLSSERLANDNSTAPFYTREEQIVRILIRRGELDLAVLPPASLSDAAKAAYEDHVSSFVADHPFMRDRDFSNLVFADYVRAFVATSPTIAGYGPSRKELLALCHDVGPFFAHFAHALSLTKNTARISEELVDDVLRSFHVEERHDRYFTFAQRGDRAALALSYGESGDVLGFEISDLSGAVEVTTPLARCVIVTDCGLVLRSTSGVCELGPDVLISVETLDLRAERVFAFGGADEDSTGVLIAASEIESHARIRVAARPDGALSVVIPDAIHPWNTYALKWNAGASVAARRDFGEALVYTRRILTSFGRSLGDAPARNADFIDRIIIGNSSVGARVLRGLSGLGVVRRDQSVYRLDLGVLGSFGVSYAALRGPRFEETLGPLVERVLAD